MNDKNNGENSDSIIDILHFAATASKKRSSESVARMCKSNEGTDSPNAKKRRIERRFRDLKRGKIDSIPKRGSFKRAGEGLHGDSNS